MADNQQDKIIEKNQHPPLPFHFEKGSFHYDERDKFTWNLGLWA